MACCPYASCPSFLLFSPSFFCLCPSFFCFSLAFLPLAIASSILCCLNRVASIVPCRFTHTLLLPPLCQRLFHTVLPQSCPVVSLTLFFLLPPLCLRLFHTVLPQSCPVVSLTPFFLLPPLCQRLFHTVLPQLCCLNRVLSFHSHPSFLFLPFACAYSIPCCLNRVASIAPCRFTHSLLSCSSPFPALIPYRVASIVLPQLRPVHSHPSFLFLPFACAYSIPCCLNCTHLPRLLFFSPILPWPLVFHVAIVPLCFNHTLLCSSWLPLALIIIHA